MSGESQAQGRSHQGVELIYTYRNTPKTEQTKAARGVSTYLQNRKKTELEGKEIKIGGEAEYRALDIFIILENDKYGFFRILHTVEPFYC